VISILVKLVTISTSLVGLPLTFVSTAVVVYLHTVTFSLLGALGNLTLVYGIFVPFDSKVWLFCELFEVKHFRNHLVLAVDRT